MRFIQENDIYKILRITGTQDNLLGICLANDNKQPIEIEVIEWRLNNNEPIKATKSEVKRQVLSDLSLVNQELNSDYKISKIYFVAEDSPSSSVYEFLIQELIKHLDRGEIFEKV